MCVHSASPPDMRINEPPRSLLFSTINLFLAYADYQNIEAIWICASPGSPKLRESFLDVCLSVLPKKKYLLDKCSLLFSRSVLPLEQKHVAENMSRDFSAAFQNALTGASMAFSPAKRPAKLVDVFLLTKY
ncbi:hypothetical protein HBI79_069240 [Parastagonospora nodorum]|nr:hypothetical protein HBI79_069240 [Parastagonospora nodorum]